MLGLHDFYLLEVASGDTFMSKYKDDAMELIETVMESSHHNPERPFGQGAMPRGQMIDAKLVEIGLFLDIIEKMVEVHNLLLDHLNIRNGF